MAAIENNFLPDAFDHNRSFKTKNKKVVGCHDLQVLLQAQSRGLVVAAVKKLPGDNLPKGVYTVLLTCRPDVDRPDSDQSQRIAPHDGTVWEMVCCTNCDCTKQSSVQSECTERPSRHQSNKKTRRQSKSTASDQDEKKECPSRGILFKFPPYLKTIYDPALWPDDKLKTFCLTAYNEAEASGRTMTAGGVTYWEGKAIEEGQEFWMGGFLKNGKIKNFYFIHPEDLELKTLA